MQKFSELSDQAILHELGMRLGRYRLNKNLTQEELALEAGTGINTIYRIEQGQSVQLFNLIRVLKVLGLIANLDALVPEPPLSPIQQARLKRQQRRRASHRRKGEQPGSWKWGDES